LLQKDKFLDIVKLDPQGVVILEEGELHDEAKKDIRGKKTKPYNIVHKVKIQLNQRKWSERHYTTIKPKRNCNFCGNPSHWMCNCVELSNEIKKHIVECDQGHVC